VCARIWRARRERVPPVLHEEPADHDVVVYRLGDIVAGTVRVRGRDFAHDLAARHPLVLADVVIQPIGTGPIAVASSLSIEPGDIVAFGRPGRIEDPTQGFIIERGPYLIFAAVPRRRVPTVDEVVESPRLVVTYQSEGRWHRDQLADGAVFTRRARDVRVGSDEDYEVARSLRRIVDGA
jgi:hypothetical protein